MSDTTMATPRAHPSQACDCCRASKIKCMPVTSNSPSPCKNCIKSGKTCAWAERKPRKAKRPVTEGSKARIAALEAKLEELVANVSTGNKSSSVGRPGDGKHTYPSPTESSSSHPPSQQTKCQNKLVTEWWLSQLGRRQSHDSSSGYQFDEATNLDDHPLSLDPRLSVEDAEGLICRFREMSLYFPFVILPADATIASLSQSRPMLLLAVLTVASTSLDRSLQSRLERKLRTLLLEKIMFDGEKSLDLLAALLVYLSWYHFFYLPKKQQASQIMHLAASMSQDLGLHLRPKEAIAVRYGLNLEHYARQDEDSEAEHDAFFSREARRLYLGLFYKIASLSWLGRPSPMPYTDYMQECAQSLADDPEYPTDEAIAPILELQCLADKHHKSLFIARLGSLPRETVQLLQQQLDETHAQFDIFRASLPTAVQHSTFFELALHSSLMHIHELDLINPFVDQALLSSQQQWEFSTALFQSTTNPMSHGNTITNPFRNEILTTCLYHARSCIESFLTIPPHAYPLVSSLQWYNLIYATVIVYRLGTGVKSLPDWDVEIARREAPLENYLATLCRRIAEATSIADEDPERNEDAKMIVDHAALLNVQSAPITDSNSSNGPQYSRKSASESEAASTSNIASSDPPRKDLYALLGPIWSSTRETYIELTSKSWSHSVGRKGAAHSTDFDNLSKHPPRKKWTHPCPAFKFWKGPPGENEV